VIGDGADVLSRVRVGKNRLGDAQRYRLGLFAGHDKFDIRKAFLSRPIARPLDDVDDFPNAARVEFAIPAGGLVEKLRVPGNDPVGIPPMDLGGKNLLGAFIKVSDVIFIADWLQPLAAPTDIDSQSQVKVIESKPPGRVDQLLFQHVRYYKVESVPIEVKRVSVIVGLLFPESNRASRCLENGDRQITRV
jgi:hypothetical protein